ncbi:hypothetical protein [Wenzhouxiangella marina]|uniref:Uncharacterized protein n=1 Tax=Wenzhouxiangella marina TaxID=1579979 RepID=A0A0K0XY70_9GAMM|nr:hypothetical protein [Wenzhouxiangella marina]AKS42571.1 hypothetical protein WM2015_2208 [Wenzhouxiangella marina]MBB6085647.1 hypothetical protein [Wenzhouxiangella marina]
MMETFAAIEDYLRQYYEVVHDEPFMLGLEVPVGDSGRRQSVFVAELKSQEGKRFLRFETTVAPLADHDPVKCLRVNLMLRTGYLAVGDLEGLPFLKLCENLPYSAVDGHMLDYVIEQVAELGDKIEVTLNKGGDWF